MTVFVAHAQPDEAIAASLAKALERRGNFVEFELAERIGRPLQNNDVLVLLWSQKMLFEPGRLVLERRALDAWADGKLVLVRLDHTILPVGMRDLAAIDASFEQRRAFTWEDVAAKVREAMRAAPPPAPAAAPAPQSLDRATPRVRRKARRKGAGAAGLFALLLLILLAAGLWQLLTARALTLPIGAGVTIPSWGLLAASGVWVLVALLAALLGGRRAREPAAKAAPPPPAEAEAPPPALSQALFVSYAHADGPAVEPVVAAVKDGGREIWMDKGGIQAGEGWAGEIVRAIRGAKAVLVMCSDQAFQSDHVKREVYLADRYKKAMVPVFIEHAELPEDFEYFFAGVQWLELYKLPEGERGEVVVKALAAV